jgi:hypothetical protein
MVADQANLAMPVLKHKSLRERDFALMKITWMNMFLDKRISLALNAYSARATHIGLGLPGKESGRSAWKGTDESAFSRPSRQ